MYFSSFILSLSVHYFYSASSLSANTYKHCKDSQTLRI